MMGIMDITNEMVAYALPSRTTLARSEHRLAAHCVIVSRQEIKNDGAKNFESCRIMVTDPVRITSSRLPLGLDMIQGQDQKLSNDT